MTLEPPVQFEPPRNVSFKNVMFWEIKSKELLELKRNGDTQSATLLSKAKKFLEVNSVERIGLSSWKILPIPHYNKTTYTVQDTKEGWICNCQGFSNNNFCSHILAVKQFEFIGRYNNGKEVFDLR